MKTYGYPPSFVHWLEGRAHNDIGLLWQENGTIKAGIKFTQGEEVGFNRQFGRDTNYFIWQTLHLWPERCRHMLQSLLDQQGNKLDANSEEEPGKILHETPAPPPWPMTVYMSLDSTPLTLISIAAYFRHTHDKITVRQWWPQILAGLNWMDKFGDCDQDGFLEYRRSNPLGLVNQAWKDSFDAYQHGPGRPAPTPIAPVEVQGWAYMALLGVAELATAVMEQPELSTSLQTRARKLQEKFNNSFWMPSRQFLALGLDAHKQPIRSITSNPGQALYSGIVDSGLAGLVVERLMKPDMLTPWGIRTLSSKERTFNSSSYHNGSVWLFDNWVIAMGMRRYGFHDEADEVARCIMAACSELAHLPELYVVRDRGKTQSLHQYTSSFDPYGTGVKLRQHRQSCSIQAWSAGAILHLLTT